jgi:hypothetical protein
LEKETSDPQDSSPPEAPPDEPVTAVPTNDTTPVWAQTRPVAPAEDAPGAESHDDADEALPPAIPMEKGDPDWSAPESSTNGEPREAPQWAATIPTSPGDPVDEGQPVEQARETPKEAAWSQAVAAAAPHAAAPEAAPKAAAQDAAPDAAPETATEPEPKEEPPVAAPITEPPRAVAADALKATWPPRSESTPAPAVETDIWPPDPPTEPSMPAWPPSSELGGHAQPSEEEGEEPATPAQAIPTWPDSFDETAPAPAEPAAQAHEEPAATAPPRDAQPAQTPPPAPVAQPVASASTPPAIPTPSTPPSSPAPRPAWAPGAAAADTPPAPHKETAPAMQVPSWAPRVPLASEPGTPTWFSPKEQIPHATAQPVVQPTPPPAPAPPTAPPVAGGHLPVAPAPAAAPVPAPTKPQAESKGAWQVVEQPHAAKGPQGPTAEDRSYAEWFAWAKRGGAPASACHAAAQGAFKALASGKDVTTAVQWATAAMSRPPENVAFGRQQYCAWFALANIDLNMDQHRSHAFAGAAVAALDAGMDASAAHVAGLQAAGYR